MHWLFFLVVGCFIWTIVRLITTEAYYRNRNRNRYRRRRP